MDKQYTDNWIIAAAQSFAERAQPIYAKHKWTWRRGGYGTDTEEENYIPNIDEIRACALSLMPCASSGRIKVYCDADTCIISLDPYHSEGQKLEYRAYRPKPPPKKPLSGGLPLYYVVHSLENKLCYDAGPFSSRQSAEDWINGTVHEVVFRYRVVMNSATVVSADEE